MVQIANDGNLLPHPVTLTRLDEQGIAERYDIVIDFSRYTIGDKVWMVNLAEHQNGAKPSKDLSLAAGAVRQVTDPCVGKFLEFRVVRNPAKPDVSQVPGDSDPESGSVQHSGGARADIRVWRRRQPEPERSGHMRFGPWGIKTDNGAGAQCGFRPSFGGAKVRYPRNLDTHQRRRRMGPSHPHPLRRRADTGPQWQCQQRAAWEQGRKDVYRLRPAGSVTLTMQFRDWGGMFMEHCHNTVHEDNAMLLRWEIDNGGAPFLRPLPTPIPTPQGVTFQAPDEILPNRFLERTGSRRNEACGPSFTRRPAGPV